MRWRNCRHGYASGNARRDLLPYAQAVRNAIDVAEPARDQVDLQNPPVVETDLTQPIQVISRHFPGMTGQLGGIIEHGSILVGQIRLRVIPPQRGGQPLVESDPLEELGMALDSVETAVEGAHDRRNHFVLPARQR